MYYFCNMKDDARQLRKNIDLSFDIIETLAEQANKDNRSIKNYMEIVLTAHAMKLRLKKDKTVKA